MYISICTLIHVYIYIFIYIHTHMCIYYVMPVYVQTRVFPAFPRVYSTRFDFCVSFCMSQPSDYFEQSATQCNPCQRTSAFYSTLQHTATHCNTLQPIAKTAAHCNALQRTAMHCNALQRTAPHCNTTHCRTL